MGIEPGNNLEVLGATLYGFVRACINLKIFAGFMEEPYTEGIEPMRWYPMKRLFDMEKAAIQNFEDASPILERVGIEMINAWYNLGPGRAIIKRGIDFLYFQTGSQGYRSVVKGPEDFIGSFALIDMDEKKGAALIRSTTPFNKDLERGIIIGGMSAPGDLDYVDVTNEGGGNLFKIEFH